jgi:hypothetical protein
MKETGVRAKACMDAFEGIDTDRIAGKTLGEFLAGEVRLNKAEPKPDGSFGFTFSGFAIQMMAEAFAEQFKAAGAVNYLELLFQHDELGPLTVTMQRVEGLTPVQKLAAAEKELKQWRDLATAAAQDDADWHKLTDRKNDLICKLADVLIAQAARAQAAEQQAKKQGLYACELFDEVKRLQKAPNLWLWEHIGSAPYLTSVSPVNDPEASKLRSEGWTVRGLCDATQPFTTGQRIAEIEQLLQPPVIPLLGSTEVNDASWKLHELMIKLGPLNGHQFNGLKNCFYEALKVCFKVEVV